MSEGRKPDPSRANSARMDRAFSPLVLFLQFSRGVAPGWYGCGPLALHEIRDNPRDTVPRSNITTYRFSPMNRRHFIQLSLAGIGAASQRPTLLAAPAAESAPGELLYNGIQLPAEWPPHLSHPASRPDKTPPHLATPPAVIPIDVGRQLFVDDFLVEETTLKRTFHLPEWHPVNPVLQPDQAWEKLGPAPMAAPFSDGVWWDPQDRLFKLWYMAGYRRATALAVSEDGIKWQKRDCGVVPGTNIVHTGDRDSAIVWLDLDEPDPKRRFRLY